MANSTSPTKFTLAYLEEDISGQVIAAVTTILVICTILLGARVWARKLSPAKSGWDDWLIYPAWVLLIGGCVTGYLSVSEGGAGRHVAAVVHANPATMVKRTQLVYALSWFTGFSNTFSRCSILALYLRIFPTGLLRVGTWITLVYLVLFLTAQAITSCLICRPLSLFWLVGPAGPTCINLFLFYQMSGILNIIGDVAVMFLPIPTILKLQTSHSRKVGIALCFASGSIGIVASCIRTASFFDTAKTSATDPTWADVALITWTLVETGMYLAAACLVGLRPVLSLCMKWLKSRTSRLSSHQRRYNNGPSSGAEGYRKGSTAHIVPSSSDEVDLKSFDRTRNIRVDHQFSVTSVRADAASYESETRAKTFVGGANHV